MTMHPTTGAAHRAQRGFTLIELAALLTFAVVSLLSLHTALLATLDTRKQTQVSETVQTQGHDLLQRLLTIPFGTETDPPATGLQLTELFDDDSDFGSAALRQLVAAHTATGHSFALTRAGVTVNWRVKVHGDLDGDGNLTGFRENRPDLLAIEIHADGRQVFRALRAADYLATRKD